MGEKEQESKGFFNDKDIQVSEPTSLPLGTSTIVELGSGGGVADFRSKCTESVLQMHPIRVPCMNSM